MKLENIQFVERPAVEESTESTSTVVEFKPKQFENFKNAEALADLAVESIQSLQPTSTGKGLTTRQGMATRLVTIGDKTYRATVQLTINLNEIKQGEKSAPVNYNTIKQAVKSTDPKVREAAKAELDRLAKELGF